MSDRWPLDTGQGPGSRVRCGLPPRPRVRSRSAPRVAPGDARLSAPSHGEPSPTSVTWHSARASCGARDTGHCAPPSTDTVRVPPVTCPARQRQVRRSPAPAHRDGTRHATATERSRLRTPEDAFCGAPGRTVDSAAGRSAARPAAARTFPTAAAPGQANGSPTRPAAEGLRPTVAVSGFFSAMPAAPGRAVWIRPSVRFTRTPAIHSEEFSGPRKYLLSVTTCPEVGLEGVLLPGQSPIGSAKCLPATPPVREACRCAARDAPASTRKMRMSANRATPTGVTGIWSAQRCDQPCRGRPEPARAHCSGPDLTGPPASPRTRFPPEKYRGNRRDTVILPCAGSACGRVTVPCRPLVSPRNSKV